jgi:hypothetical protein
MRVYILIFLYLPDFLISPGLPVRQILTSRRGQRPSAWMDFSEVREVMLGWDGYKIMCLSRAVSLSEIRSNLIPCIGI